MDRQERDVFTPVAERRHGDVHDVEAIEQVQPEPPGIHLLAKGAIGRRHDSDVYSPRDILADAPQLAVLNDTQHLCLSTRRQLADLVEEQCSAMRFFKDTSSIADSPGERTAGVTEELRLDQVVGERRAVQRAERLVAAHAPAVDGPRHQLLSAPAFAVDQHAERSSRRSRDALPKGGHHRRHAEQFAGPLVGPQLPRDGGRQDGSGNRGAHRENRAAARGVVRRSDRPARAEGADRGAAVRDWRGAFNSIVMAMGRDRRARRYSPLGDLGFEARANRRDGVGSAVANRDERNSGSVQVLTQARAHVFQQIDLVGGGLAHSQDGDELVDERIGGRCSPNLPAGYRLNTAWFTQCDGARRGLVE